MGRSALCHVLAAVALQLASNHATADELRPGAEVVINGRVVEIVSDDAFWFVAAGQRLLVFHHLLLPGEVHNGQQLRIHGQVSDDWVRLAETEINARRIERPAGAD